MLKDDKEHKCPKCGEVHFCSCGNVSMCDICDYIALTEEFEVPPKLAKEQKLQKEVERLTRDLDIAKNSLKLAVRRIKELSREWAGADELPCKVGDTVYIDTDSIGPSRVIECRVTSIKTEIVKTRIKSYTLICINQFGDTERLESRDEGNKWSLVKPEVE